MSKTMLTLHVSPVFGLEVQQTPAASPSVLGPLFWVPFHFAAMPRPQLAASLAGAWARHPARGRGKRRRTRPQRPSRVRWMTAQSAPRPTSRKRRSCWAARRWWLKIWPGGLRGRWVWTRATWAAPCASSRTAPRCPSSRGTARSRRGPWARRRCGGWSVSWRGPRTWSVAAAGWRRPYTAAKTSRPACRRLCCRRGGFSRLRVRAYGSTRRRLNTFVSGVRHNCSIKKQELGRNRVF